MDSKTFHDRLIDAALHDLEARLDILVDFDSPEYPELLTMLEEHGVENIFSLAGIICACLKGEENANC